MAKKKPHPKAAARKNAKAQSQKKPPAKKQAIQKKNAPAKPKEKVKKKAPKKSPAAPPKKGKGKPSSNKKGKRKKQAVASAKKKGGAKSKGKPTSKKTTKKKGGRGKKNKGSTEFQRIKKYLLDKYKRRCNIETDKDANQTASNLLKWLKSKGKLKNKKKVTHKLLKEALNELFPQEQRKLGRRSVPEIPDYAQQPNEFYNIEDVIRDIDRGLYKRVWIYSPLILGKRNNGYVFLNGDRKHTYEETFQGWVDWVNEQIRDGYFKEGSPPDIWYRFLEVFFNKRRKRWEVKIIPCDVDGDCLNTGYITEEDCDTDETEDRYGINPDEVEAEKKAKEEAEALAKKAEEDAKKKVEDQKKPAPPAEEAKEVTAAKVKAEAARENDLKVQMLIRVKQSIMEEIKFMKEIGEDYKDQLAKLKEVNAKIDELWRFK